MPTDPRPACPACGGSGKVWATLFNDGRRLCDKCHGTGKVPAPIDGIGVWGPKCVTHGAVMTCALADGTRCGEAHPAPPGYGPGVVEILYRLKHEHLAEREAIAAAVENQYGNTAGTVRLSDRIRRGDFARPAPDACEVCHGAKGGVAGNENIVNGVVMCDYCDAARHAKDGK